MLNLGVIGYGYWGPNLVRNFNSLASSNVKYVCDLDVSRVALAEIEHRGVIGVLDYREVVDDPAVDAIAIATPISSHFRLAKAALEAGKHVLVEKPLAARSEEAVELTVLAQRKNLVLQVDHTYLYCAPVRRIKEMLHEGALGDVLYIDSVRVNLGLFQESFSVTWDLAPHDISIMMYLLERPIRSVAAVAVAHYGDFNQPHNMAYLTLDFEGGTLGHIHVNWLAPVKLRRMMIGGTRSMLVWDDVEPDEKVRLYEKSIEIDLTQEKRYESLVQYRLGDMTVPRLDNYEALRAECSDFVQSVTEGAPVESDGWFGARLVSVLEAAEKSLVRNGMPVEVDHKAVVRD